jgi:hypothetical protein
VAFPVAVPEMLTPGKGKKGNYIKRLRWEILTSNYIYIPLPGRERVNWGLFPLHAFCKFVLIHQGAKFKEIAFG